MIPPIICDVTNPFPNRNAIIAVNIGIRFIDMPAIPAPTNLMLLLIFGFKPVSLISF